MLKKRKIIKEREQQRDFFLSLNNGFLNTLASGLVNRYLQQSSNSAG